MAIDWPDRFERTDPSDRTRNNSYQATLGSTTQDLATEMDRLDPDEWRASTASGGAYTKSNGLPKAKANPSDPGFVVYWTKDGEQFAVACDDSPRLRDNVRTVYLWIHETRLRGNRPVVTGESEFATARLPPGDVDDDRGATGEAIVANGPVDLDVEQAADILGVSPDSPDRVVKTAYQEKTKTAHPDVGGSSAEFHRVEQAKQVLLDDA